MRRSITVVAVAAAITGAAPASSAEKNTLRHEYKALYAKVERTFGNGAAGRNIVLDGVHGRRGDRPARHAEVARSIRTMRSMLAPPPVQAEPSVEQSSISAPASSAPAPAGSAGGCGASCVKCESSGNPQAIGGGGKYWGLYQFDRQTWEAHGGSSGSYGNAGAAEQHRVAANITYDAWPNC